MTAVTKHTAFGKVLILWLAGLGAAAQFGKVSVVYPMLGQVYGDSPVLGFALSLVGFVGVVLGVTAGVLVARVGFRRALILALMLGAAASAYQASLPGFGLFLISRVLEGASHLAIVVAAPTLIAQLSAERHRGFTLSLWSTFFGVAFAILVWFGLPLARAFGVPALFGAHAAYMALMAVVVALSLRAGAIPRSSEQIGVVQILKDHVRIYRSPYLSAAALGWVCYAGSFVAILTLMPAFLPESGRDLVVGLMPLAGIAASMTLGVALLRRWPAIAVVITGFSVCLILATLLWGNSGQVWPYLALAAGLGLVQGSSFALVPQLNSGPQAQALANGAMAQMGNVGTTFGTPILAMLISLAGIDGFMIFAMVLFGVGITAHLLLRNRRRRYAENMFT